LSTQYLDRAKKLKERLDELTAFKTRAQGQLDQLLKQKEQIESEIRSMGISPDNIDTYIAELETDIRSLMDQADSIIPRDILNQLSNK